MTATLPPPAPAPETSASAPATKPGHHRAMAGWIPGYFTPRPGQRRPRSQLDVTITWSLVVLSLAAVWALFFALVLSSLQVNHNQSNLYSRYREQLAGQVAPLGGVIAADAPVALLSMSRAGLSDEVVVEGTASGDLLNGPGHRRDTALPGQAGLSIIYGRAQLFGGPFGSIAEAHKGDLITVTTQQGIAKYRVEQVRHVGDPFSPTLTATQGRLTLVTSEASGWRAGWAPTRPVYVDALLVGKTFPTPPGRLTSVPRAELAMKADKSALFPLVLWLPLLILAALAAVWAQDRWGRWQTWLVGAPVVLAALWGVSETASRLLPNLT